VYLRKSIPPLVILGINTSVIGLLGLVCVYEGYDSHSAFQAAVYTKTVFYTILNMFVIPVLTLSSEGASLYDLFISNDFNLARLLGELFIPKSGEFFIILLVQQGLASFVNYGLNLPDIVFSYMMPSLAFERRKIYND